MISTKMSKYKEIMEELERRQIDYEDIKLLELDSNIELDSTSPLHKYANFKDCTINQLINLYNIQDLAHKEEFEELIEKFLELLKGSKEFFAMRNQMFLRLGIDPDNLEETRKFSKEYAKYKLQNPDSLNTVKGQSLFMASIKTELEGEIDDEEEEEERRKMTHEVDDDLEEGEDTEEDSLPLGDSPSEQNPPTISEEKVEGLSSLGEYGVASMDSASLFELSQTVQPVLGQMIYRTNSDHTGDGFKGNPNSERYTSEGRPPVFLPKKMQELSPHNPRILMYLEKQQKNMRDSKLSFSKYKKASSGRSSIKEEKEEQVEQDSLDSIHSEEERDDASSGKGENIDILDNIDNVDNMENMDNPKIHPLDKDKEAKKLLKEIESSQDINQITQLFDSTSNIQVVYTEHAKKYITSTGGLPPVPRAEGIGPLPILDSQSPSPPLINNPPKPWTAVGDHHQTEEQKEEFKFAQIKVSPTDSQKSGAHSESGGFGDDTFARASDHGTLQRLLGSWEEPNVVREPSIQEDLPPDEEEEGERMEKPAFEQAVKKHHPNVEIDTAQIEIVKFLGSGGEGRVFLGNIRGINQYIAFKQFDVVVHDENAQQLFDVIVKEFEIVKKLNHPNIIKYFKINRSFVQNLEDIIEYNIIMEYMMGGSLYDLLKKNKRGLPLDQTKKILRQVVEGINYLHKHKILHRDLKPGNILLNADQTICKITDFGISTEVKERMTTVKRTCAGTPWYMAPEIILSKPYNYAVDIWSLGCFTYELLTGIKPYASYDGVQALFQMVQNVTPLEIAPPRVRNLMASNKYTAAKQFLEICWRAKPSERPSAAHLLRHKFLRLPKKKQVKIGAGVSGKEEKVSKGGGSKKVAKVLKGKVNK